MSKYTLPRDFYLGAATSAYQIEGAWNEGGRGESIWDRFSHTPDRIMDQTSGDVACDHYHRWREDIGLIAELGLHAYRFSISWSRILPQGRGKLNPDGLAFYDQLVDGLLELGVTPFVTLFHWDLPQALQDSGGWADRATIEAFCQYAEVVSRRLGDRVKHWVTHNEPWVHSFLGHHYGWHAPGIKDGPATQVAHNLLVSHGLAVPIIRANSPHSQVGIALNLAPSHPASSSEADVAAARRTHLANHAWFLDPLHGRGYPREILAIYERHGMDPMIQPGDMGRIAAPLDFIGVNYYFRNVLQHDPECGVLQCRAIAPEGAEFSALGWEIYPDGLRDLLVNLHRGYAPAQVYVLENGMVDHEQTSAEGAIHDRGRVRYLDRHIESVARAIAAGVPVRGYFAWSLLDNFEWGYGLTKRFGLIHVDYATQRRTLKDSAYFLQSLCSSQLAQRSLAVAG